jgi:hypothetical protein
MTWSLDDHGGVSVTRDAIRLTGALHSDWKAADDPRVLLTATLDALVSAILRMPWMSPKSEILFRGRALEAPAIEMSETSGGELSALLSNTVPLAHTVKVPAEAIGWMNDLLLAAVQMPASRLRELLPTLAALDSAAQATHPYDQVIWLWVALEGWGQRSVAKTVEALLDHHAVTADVLRRLSELAKNDVAALIMSRKRIASYAHVSAAPLLAQLRGPLPRSARGRLELGVGCAIGLRHAVVHADAPRSPARERASAEGAQGLLWALVCCLLEQRLKGSVSVPTWARTERWITV